MVKTNNNYSFPEVDKFRWIPLSEADTYLHLPQKNILPKLITDIDMQKITDDGCNEAMAISGKLRSNLTHINSNIQVKKKFGQDDLIIYCNDTSDYERVKTLKKEKIVPEDVALRLFKTTCNCTKYWEKQGNKLYTSLV